MVPPVMGPGGAGEVALTTSGVVGRGLRVVMSVGGPCPHEAVRAEGHEHDDGEDQEFHGHSLPLPRCAHERDHNPGSAQHHIPELRNMQSVSGNRGKVSGWAVGASSPTMHGCCCAWPMTPACGCGTSRPWSASPSAA